MLRSIHSSPPSAGDTLTASVFQGNSMKKTRVVTGAAGSYHGSGACSADRDKRATGETEKSACAFFGLRITA